MHGAKCPIKPQKRKPKMKNVYSAIYGIAQIVMWITCSCVCIFYFEMSWLKGILIGTLICNIVMIPVAILYWVAAIKAMNDERMNALDKQYKSYAFQKRMENENGK